MICSPTCWRTCRRRVYAASGIRIGYLWFRVSSGRKAREVTLELDCKMYVPSSNSKVVLTCFLILKLWVLLKSWLVDWIYQRQTFQLIILIYRRGIFVYPWQLFLFKTGPSVNFSVFLGKLFCFYEKRLNLGQYLNIYKCV